MPAISRIATITFVKETERCGTLFECLKSSHIAEYLTGKVLFTEAVIRGYDKRIQWGLHGNANKNRHQVGAASIR